MRPQRAPLHPRASSLIEPDAGLRAVASASFIPRGDGYDPTIRLRRKAIALRGGEQAIIVAFAFVRGAVRIRVLALGECSSADIEWAIETARRIAALDDDPSEFLSMVRDHDVLGKLAREADSRVGRTPTIFESLTVSIIEQLVTGFEARKSVQRLWRIAGAAVPKTKLVVAPTAAAVRRVPMWRLHAIGVGSRRALTLHEAAGRGDAIERLSTAPPETFIEKIQSLRGIGPWTANAVARDALGYADAVPIDDFHAPFIVTTALGGPPDLTLDQRDEANRWMLELLEPFRPHRARAALLLERRAIRDRTAPLPKIDAHRREPWRY